MTEILFKILVALVQLISLQWTSICDGTVNVPKGNYTIPEGGELSINCSATDEALTGWFTFSGKKITNDPSARVHVRSSGSLKYLEIPKVNKADRGTYECRGTRNKTQIRLNVEYSPVLISESSTHGTIFSSLDSNEEITLKCKFDGFPVPELKFQFAGVNLNSIFNASGFVSYKFRVTRPRDFGFYSCVAENKMGTVTHYIEVYERGPPEPPNNVQASSTCDSIEVTWEASLKDGGSPVTGYTVKLLSGGESVASESLTNLSRSKSFTNLKKKTEYEVRLNSNNALGGGEWRSISLNTTVACPEKRGSSGSALKVVTSILTLIMSTSVHLVL